MDELKERIEEEIGLCMVLRRHIEETLVVAENNTFDYVTRHEIEEARSRVSMAHSRLETALSLATRSTHNAFI